EFVGVERGEQGKRFAKIRNQSTGSDLISYELKSPGNRANPKVVFKGYDPRNRDWYKAAKEAGEPTWTKIYPFASHPVPGITAATPILDNSGNLRGVLGVDVSLQQINEFLSSLQISKSGEALILARSGKLVGSSIPDTRFVGSDNKLIDATDNIQPAIVQRTVQHLKDEFGSLDQIDGKQPLSSFKFNGEAQLVNVSVFKNGQGVNWLIVVVMPESDFLGDFYRSAMFTLFLGLAITGGAAVLGLIAARQISEPIFALTDAAASIDAETFDDKSLDPVTKRGDELGQLARVFQHMAIQVYSREQQLKQHVQKLDKEIGQFKKERQVAESNEKNYLLGLLQKSRSLRAKTHPSKR
ncbi:MAG TPA: cache domain-containing protein, partial [Coleofasciculaceae cyanobacterium]